MLPISPRSAAPVTSPPPARTAGGASPTDGQGPKNLGQDPRTEAKSKLDGGKPPPPETNPQPQQQALAQDRKYLSHLSDSFQQLPPEKVEGYGLEDPIKAQADAEQQAFQDILANIVPEA